VRLIAKVSLCCGLKFSKICYNLDVIGKDKDKVGAFETLYIMIPVLTKFTAVTYAHTFALCAVRQRDCDVYNDVCHT